MFTFYSKIDNWLIIIFVMGSISLLMSPFIYHRHKHIPLVQSYFVLFFPTVFALVLMWLPVFKTSYQLTQTDLIIHSGFSNTVIPRNTIIDVKPSHRLIASPALSLGVVCGRGRNPTLRLWPAIFSGEIDVFPSERRNMGQEIGR